LILAGDVGGGFDIVPGDVFVPQLFVETLADPHSLLIDRGDHVVHDEDAAEAVERDVGFDRRDVHTAEMGLASTGKGQCRLDPRIQRFVILDMQQDGLDARLHSLAAGCLRGLLGLQVNLCRHRSSPDSRRKSPIVLKHRHPCA